LKINKKTAILILAIILPLITFWVIYQYKLQSLINYNFDHTSLLILLIVSPILEELVFRGLLQDFVLKKIKNIFFSIVIVNLLFMLTHYRINHSLSYLSVVFICGIIFSVVKVYYSRIVYPILVHSYYNLSLVVIVLGWGHHV